VEAALTLEEISQEAGDALFWLWRHKRDNTDPVTVVSKETGEQYTIYTAHPEWPKKEEE
jgi:hypothetical protein